MQKLRNRDILAKNCQLSSLIEYNICTYPQIYDTFLSF